MPSPSRRSFLQSAGLTLGGLTYNPLSAPASGNVARGPLTGKTVVVLFMQGGPSQHETFDPKPDAPEGVRTVGDTIPTAIPGVRFGATFPKLAALADRLAVVRSFSTGTQHGGLNPIVGPLTQGASLGAIYSRVAGLTDPRTGLPTSACLHPIAVDATQPGPKDRFGRFETPGPLGAAFTPFVPGGGGAFQENLKLHLDAARLDDRRALLTAIDTLKRDADRSTFDGIDGFRRQAADMLLKGVANTFDLSKEDAATVARYDTAKFLDPKLWGTKKNSVQYTAHCKTLGKLLLLARRVAEAGCGVITVNTEFVWDMHADGNNVSVDDGMKLVGAPFDHAVSAFLDDLEARGLNEKVMVVMCGEMGRTPKLNKNGGRDHWPKLAPLLVWGGGLARGQVVGRSTRDGGEPADRPLDPKNLTATIARHLFDLGTVRVVPGLPAEVTRMAAAVENAPGVV